MEGAIAALPEPDFPTRVGMARSLRIITTRTSGFPHPRGDGPPVKNRPRLRLAISPPAWGWPGENEYVQSAGVDFPTRVGMARSSSRAFLRPERFPHPRGDGPQSRNSRCLCGRISPPAWGWPVTRDKNRWIYWDFPTRVGMARL